MACATVEKKMDILLDESMSLNESNEKGKKLIFQNFDKIKVSTKTFIVMTNIVLDIEKFFNFLPITNYTVVPKKRGRKKKQEPKDPNEGIQTGSIITLEYIDRIRGVDLKKKKKKEEKEDPQKKKKRRNYFRNSVTVVMIIENKKINFKVSRNGKFQMTGCKFDEHAEICVQYIWNYIKHNKSIYKVNNMKPGDADKEQEFVDSDSESESETEEDAKEVELIATFIPAMRNIDFSLNFLVDREKLDEYFNMFTNYHSLLETSFGYTGVNIKIPITKHITTLLLKQITCINGEWVDERRVTYQDYLDLLPEKERQKKYKKERYNTFLVFHSGKVIMSGLEASFMRGTYYDFLNIIRECFGYIEERLD
jgi:TATA-box binding protein (TBP) (component of TFIID and TFIIIB)